MLDSRISLDGAWEFLHVADDRLSGPAEVRPVAVPAPWQSQFADLRMRAGIGIYRRSFDIPEGWISDSVWLRFGAVFHTPGSGSTDASSARTRADSCRSPSR
jgi:beta-galactosidase/beta-glucuronidase